MNIRPVGDLILVKRMDTETRSEGGIFLPLPNQKSFGVVESIGRGILNRVTGEFKTLGVDVGDIVVFQTHRGHSAMSEDEPDMIFLSLNHVLCIYKKEDLIDGKMDIKIKVQDSINSFLK